MSSSRGIKRKICNGSTGGGEVRQQQEGRKTRRTRAGGGTIDKAELQTQRCWGLYLKPNGWRYVAGNLQDHIFIPASLKDYSTRIVKNAGIEGVHYFNGYVGLKQHFIDKEYPGVVGINTPDKIIDNMKNWFKQAFNMTSYAPEPTDEMIQLLAIKNRKDASTMTIVPAASTSNGKEGEEEGNKKTIEIIVKDTCHHCNRHVTNHQLRCGTANGKYVHSACYLDEQNKRLKAELMLAKEQVENLNDKLKASDEENKSLKAELRATKEQVETSMKEKSRASQPMEEDDEETLDDTETSFYI
jgi:hypothetical protein